MKQEMPIEEARIKAAKLAFNLVCAGITKFTFSGSVRRGKPVVGDFDVVLIYDGEDLHDALKTAGVELKNAGKKQPQGVFEGVQVDFWKTTEDSWGACLFATTGPKGYTIAYRARAKKAGYLLNHDGLYDEFGKKLAGSTEEGIYLALGKAWKLPAERGR